MVDVSNKNISKPGDNLMYRDGLPLRMEENKQDRMLCCFFFPHTINLFRDWDARNGADACKCYVSAWSIIRKLFQSIVQSAKAVTSAFYATLAKFIYYFFSLVLQSRRAAPLTEKLNWMVDSVGGVCRNCAYWIVLQCLWHNWSHSNLLLCWRWKFSTLDNRKKKQQEDAV